MNGNIRLTDQEQRLLDMARRHAIDAEIAVQLGVPVGDVKDRMERLKAKLGVETRAELVAWSPEGSVAGPVQVETATAGGGGPTPASAPAAREGISRRKVLTMGGAGLVVLVGGGGAAVALFGGRESDSPAATPTPVGDSPLSPTPVAPTGTIVPTLPPSDALSRLNTMRETQGQWATREFARGEAIPWHAGIFFMNPETGAVTGYQVAKPREGDDVEPQGYMTDDLNSVIVARGRDVGYVYNRKLRQSWEFSLKGVVVKAVSERYLLLGTGPTNEVRYDSTGPLTFALIPADGSPPRAAAELPDVGWNDVQDAFIDDELGGAWLWRVQDRQNSELYLFKNNQVTPMANYPLEPGHSPRPRWLSKGAAVIECNSQDPDLNPYSMIIRISETSLRRVIDQVPGSNADLSPDGQYIAYTETEAGDWRGQSIANEARGVFRNVVIKRIGTGDPVVRVRSADLGFGDGLVGTRWLPDSSGIVVMVRGGDDESPHQRRRMAIANIDGSRLEYLPIPLATNSRWYGQWVLRGALPAPGNQRLFSVGHYELLNASTGQFTTLDIGEDGPTHLAPWGRESDEMRFALPHGGHDGSSPAVMLEPRVEQYPFPSGMRMRVKGAGDCLNLRAFPSTTAEVRGCYPDGTLVEMSPQPSSPRVPDLAECLFTGEGEWVAVKTEDGTIGWASADYLEWA